MPSSWDIHYLRKIFQTPSFIDVRSDMPGTFGVHDLAGSPNSWGVFY